MILGPTQGKNGKKTWKRARASRLKGAEEREPRKSSNTSLLVFAFFCLFYQLIIKLLYIIGNSLCGKSSLIYDILYHKKKNEISFLFLFNIAVDNLCILFATKSAISLSGSLSFSIFNMVILSSTLLLRK